MQGVVGLQMPVINAFLNLPMHKSHLINSAAVNNSAVGQHKGLRWEYIDTNMILFLRV